MPELDVTREYEFFFPQNAPTNLSYDCGDCSFLLSIKYLDWQELSGSKVKILKYIKENLTRVYLIDDGPDYWFDVTDAYLIPLSDSSPKKFECVCATKVLMISGCKCGGV